MDLTFAELSSMERIKARFSTLIINNMAYQNHITRMMYCKRTFGGKRHFQCLMSSFPPWPWNFTLQLLSSGNIWPNTWFLLVPMSAPIIQLSPRGKNLSSRTWFVNQIQNITFKTNKTCKKKMFRISYEVETQIYMVTFLL